jgi:hypothetical protein
MTAVDTAPPLRLDRYLALLAILMALVLGLLVIGERQQPAPSLPAIEGTLPPPARLPAAAEPSAALAAERAALASRLESTEQALRRAEAEIEGLRQENRTLSDRLEGEGAALDEIARRLAAVEAERNRLADEVVTLTEARTVLEAQLAERTERPSPPPAAASDTETAQQPAAAATPRAEAAPSAPVAPTRDPSATVAAQPRGLQAALEELMREQQREPAAPPADQPGQGATAGGLVADPGADPGADPAQRRDSGRLITFNGNGGTVAEGVEAYHAGDFSTAERIWGALAASGDPRAQFHFGALMYEGRTTEPDLVMAYVWLSRAVDGGHLPAIELRRRVRAAMSEAQYQEALAVQTSS